MVDMLSGVLTGSGFLSAVHSPYKTAEKSNCGHMMVAMDIAKFQPLEQFYARMAAFTGEIKSVPLAKGFDEVFYPGEIENNNDAKFRREGMSLPDDTVADLKRIAKETGLEARLPL
jgi:LDH2 family malate/lactate/ureidoglycolate dehydrogenase